MMVSCFSPLLCCWSYVYSFISRWKMNSNSSFSIKIWMTVLRKRPFMFSTSCLQRGSILFECFSLRTVEMISGNSSL